MYKFLASPVSFLILFSVPFLFSSCGSSASYKKAQALLEPIDESGVRGIVIFSQEERGMRIIAEFSGLTPGLHGLHIHEHGDCGGKGAVNAGAHFNPDKSPHAGPYDSPGHSGDLGNVEANIAGYARLNRMDFVITLEGQESILGKSIIIHKFRDDYLSQPSGNTGPGVACGIIYAMD